MAHIPITYVVNGAAPVLGRDLGISLRSLERRNMQTDQAHLQWTRRRASVACPLAHDDEVEIFRGETRIFRGRVRFGQGNERGYSLQVIGPWARLEEYYYQISQYGSLLPKEGGTVDIAYGPEEEWWDGSAWQPFPPVVTYTFLTTGGLIAYDGGTTGEINLNFMWTSMYYLFNKVVGVPKTVVQQLGELFFWCYQMIDPAPFAPGEISALGAVQLPKIRAVADLRVSEAIQQTLSGKPDAAIWFDYGPDVPEVNIRVASLEEAIELTVGGAVLRDYRVRPVDELIAHGVVVRFQEQFSEIYGFGFPTLVDAYPAGTACYDAKIVLQTVATTESAGYGAAQSVYESLSPRRGDGTLVVRDAVFGGGWRPGQVVQIVGDPVMAGVKLWVQSVVWDALKAETTLTVGYPAHLNIRDMISLRKYARTAFLGLDYQIPQVWPS